MPENDFDDDAREDLRETLRRVVKGELRLSQRNHVQIVEHCREVYIQDEAPEEEWGVFCDYAKEEVERAAAGLEIEKVAWPQLTDCDRLDRAEAILRDRGILFWQASPCCDTCTWGEVRDRIGVVDDFNPGFSDRVRGCAFLIDQNMADSLSEGTRISVYLGYGWISPDEEVESDAYQRNSLAVAREVAECLREQGLRIDWNGEMNKKIGVSIDWRRRSLLE